MEHHGYEYIVIAKTSKPRTITKRYKMYNNAIEKFYNMVDSDLYKIVTFIQFYNGVCTGVKFEYKNGIIEKHYPEC